MGIAIRDAGAWATTDKSFAAKRTPVDRVAGVDK